MIRSACIFVALGLAAAGSTALAASPKPQPVMMTDAQMDDVTAGSLTIVFNNSLNNWSIGDGVLFVLNFIANVNTAIANGGDAAAGQSVGSQTITTTLAMPTSTVTTVTGGHGKK
jgi:hypothetical protein